MPKIVIFINTLSRGGAARVVTSLSNYLVNNGYYVKILTAHGEEKDFYVLDRRVKRFSLRFLKVNNGINKVIDNLCRIYSLRLYLRKEKPDIVVGIMTTCAVMTILASIGLPVKTVVSERNFPGRKKVVKQWELLRHAVYRFASAHIAQTREIAQWLKRNCSAKNIVVIPNSVSWPIPRHDPILAPEQLLPKNRKMILAVGSLSIQKGFDLLIKSFSIVSNEHPDWTLVILGEQDGKDPDRQIPQKLHLQINKLHLKNRILLPGCVGNIGDWYQRADIFVLSSRYEGFPNVLLEAMSGACPCISYDCDTGPRDIIRHGINGILVKPESVNEMAKAIKNLIDNENLRKKIGRNAITVKEKFSENVIFSQWTSLFDMLCIASTEK